MRCGGYVEAGEDVFYLAGTRKSSVEQRVASEFGAPKRELRAVPIEQRRWSRNYMLNLADGENHASS